MLYADATLAKGTPSMKPKPDLPITPITPASPLPPLLPSPSRRRLMRDGALLLGLPALAAPAPVSASALARAPALDLRAATLLAPMFGMEQQGQASGIFVDALNELARESGIRISNVMVPKVRGQLMLETGGADLMIGFDSAALLAHARHVAVVASFDVGVVARAGIRLQSLNDLHGLTVGQLRGADYSRDFVQDGAILKYETNTMAQILRMLAIGRVDAAIGVRESLYYGMRSEGIAPQRVGDFLALESKQAWLHYASGTYDAALAGRLAAAMQRLQAAGTIAAIIQRYAGEVAGTARR